MYLDLYPAEAIPLLLYGVIKARNPLIVRSEILYQLLIHPVRNFKIPSTKNTNYVIKNESKIINLQLRITETKT